MPVFLNVIRRVLVHVIGMGSLWKHLTGGLERVGLESRASISTAHFGTLQLSSRSFSQQRRPRRRRRRGASRRRHRKGGTGSREDQAIFGRRSWRQRVKRSPPPSASETAGVLCSSRTRSHGSGEKAGGGTPLMSPAPRRPGRNQRTSRDRKQAKPTPPHFST